MKIWQEIQLLGSGALVLAIALAGTSCRHVGPDQYGAPDDDDADDDTDTDTDSESFTGYPTDTESGYCNQEPEICYDIGLTPLEQYSGCCYDGALYWCWEPGPGPVDSIDCEANGGYCGFDPDSQWMDCIYD
jgi:hypothetical protein